jgi:aspartate/methionine/tyrosine aminotransferase
VITVPGSGFGPTGEGHIRLSFGATEKELEKAFDRMEEWGIQYIGGKPRNTLSDKRA